MTKTFGTLYVQYELEIPALPCKLCGGRLEEKYHEAFSTDSSFDYVGCSGCDVAFADEENVNQEVVNRWNRLMGTK